MSTVITLCDISPFKWVVSHNCYSYCNSRCALCKHRRSAVWNLLSFGRLKPMTGKHCFFYGSRGIWLWICYGMRSHVQPHDYQILPAFRTVLELLERCGLCSVVYCLLQRYRLCYKLECRDYLYEYVLWCNFCISSNGNGMIVMERYCPSWKFQLNFSNWIFQCFTW